MNSSQSNLKHIPSRLRRKLDAGLKFDVVHLAESVRPLCYASCRVYFCHKRKCRYRAECERAVDPWIF